MEKREVIKARDVIFFENSFERTESNNNTDEFNVNVFAPVSEIENDDVPDSKHDVQRIKVKEKMINTMMIQIIIVVVCLEDGKTEDNKDRNERTSEKFYTQANELLNSIVEDPQTLSEALESDEAEKWKNAMKA